MPEQTPVLASVRLIGTCSQGLHHFGCLIRKYASSRKKRERKIYEDTRDIYSDHGGRAGKRNVDQHMRQDFCSVTNAHGGK